MNSNSNSINNLSEITEKLKDILNELKIEYSNILLFGSRAKEKFTEEGDWDFLIILKNSIGQREKKELLLKIYRKFHEHFPFVSIDIILKDEKSFEDEKSIANTISNEVYLEGVEI